MRRALAAVRVYLQPVIRVLNQAVVSAWAGRRGDLVHSAPSARRRENRDLQERFTAIFRKYDTCLNCVEHCCHSNINRFDYVDCYIYGRPLRDGISEWHRLGHVGESLGDLLRQIRKPESGEAPCEVCPHFVADKGCSLPVGERPSMCITGVCKKFLDSFSDEDASDYVALLKQHARFRSNCTRELVTELRRSPGEGAERPSGVERPARFSARRRDIAAADSSSAEPAVDEMSEGTSNEGRR